MAIVTEETGVLVITVYNQRSCESYSCAVSAPEWSCLGFGSLWAMPSAQKQALCARLLKLLSIGEMTVTTKSGHTTKGMDSSSKSAGGEGADAGGAGAGAGAGKGGGVGGEPVKRVSAGANTTLE